MQEGLIRILLVEDNVPYALLLQDHLAHAAGHFEVTHVERMADAVGHLQHGDFEAVLLDLSLPDSRGLATVEQATAFGPRLPIIVLTGLSDEAIATEAVRKGAQDFLLKDQRLDGPTLVRTIRYAIERKRLETDLMGLNDTLERRVAERTEEARRLSMRLRALAAELGQVEQRERRRLAQVLPMLTTALTAVLLPRAAALETLVQCRAYVWKTARFALPLAVFLTSTVNSCKCLIGRHLTFLQGTTEFLLMKAGRLTSDGWEAIGRAAQTQPAGPVDLFGFAAGVGWQGIAVGLAAMAQDRNLHRQQMANDGGGG